jgi:hypothetical protein
MAVTAVPFRGKTFFRDVRDRMWADRGMFVGSDGDFRYVCVDPGFYRICVFVRPDDQTFVASAQRADPRIRTITNGQFFTKNQHFGPGPVPWQGEVISGGALLPGGGGAGAGASFRFSGQWPGTSVPAVAFGLGSPSAVRPPLQAAIGGLLPLITAGARATPAQLGNWISKGARVGKTIYGLRRSEAVLFILVQRHSKTPLFVEGDTLPKLMDRLVDMGVDDAVLADGSDSATLLADRSVLAEPAGYKNNSIPCGPGLLLHGLHLLGTSRLVRAATTNDPAFTASLEVRGTAGSLRLAAPGAVLELTDLGTPNIGTAAQLRRDLELTLPVSFSTPKAPPRPSVPLEFEVANLRARLTLAPAQTTDGTLTGSLVVRTSRGHVDFDVFWDLEDLL